MPNEIGMTAHAAVDVHQHLWTEEFVVQLRARTQAPYLRGWTLHTTGEPPYDVDPRAHDVAERIDADHESEVGTACLSLSAPLGIEALPRAQAALLIDAWHRGVRELPVHFRAWASVPGTEPDLGDLMGLLSDERFVGLQVPATQLSSPAAWERHSGLLRAAEIAGKPVLVHPGAQAQEPLRGDVPAWWGPVVGYIAQMAAAWWAWHGVAGRSSFPDLRLVFAAGAGLAPLHQERYLLRGGGDAPVDTDILVETSGHGPRSLEALVRALGIDSLVLGSDRPYGEPLRDLLGAAATHAVRVTNPSRLLAPTRVRGGEPAWAAAS
jgi:hypothetical protein